MVKDLGWLCYRGIMLQYFSSVPLLSLKKLKISTAQRAISEMGFEGMIMWISLMLVNYM